MKDAYFIQLIDKLTAIYLMQGVQPSELADSIFEDPYTSMSLIKNINFVEVELSFKELCDITQREHTRKIKYIYSNDKFLVKILEAMDSQPFKISWDREQVINSIIVDIKNRLKDIGCSPKQIEKILTTLPNPSQISEKPKLSLVS